MSSNFICLRNKDKIQKVPYDQIEICRSIENYSEIRLFDGSIWLTRLFLNDLERIFPSQFVRCHKSFIINLEYFQEYNRKEKELVLHNGSVIPVSRRREKVFMNRLDEYMVIA